MNDIAIKMDSVYLDFPKKQGLLTLLKNRFTGEKALFNALIDINLSVKKLLREVLGIIGKTGQANQWISCESFQGSTRQIMGHVMLLEAFHCSLD